MCHSVPSRKPLPNHRLVLHCRYFILFVSKRIPHRFEILVNLFDILISSILKLKVLGVSRMIFLKKTSSINISYYYVSPVWEGRHIGFAHVVCLSVTNRVRAVSFEPIKEF